MDAPPPGQATPPARIRLLSAAGGWVELLVETLRRLPVTRPNTRAILDQMYDGGILTMPIVLMVGLFTGMLMTLQTGLELQKLGQQDMVGRVVAVAMCREMGPFLSGTILAAVVGSAMAAELGTMAVSEELTALEVMTIDITKFLVLPRVLAMALVAPFLALFTDLVGILGGGVIAVTRLGIGQELYTASVLDQLKDSSWLLGLPKDIYVGSIKSVIFGVTVAIIGCATGMRAKHGASGVGFATRSAVRMSAVMIVVLNYTLTGLFYR